MDLISDSESETEASAPAARAHALPTSLAARLAQPARKASSFASASSSNNHVPLKRRVVMRDSDSDSDDSLLGTPRKKPSKANMAASRSVPPRAKLDPSTPVRPLPTTSRATTYVVDSEDSEDSLLGTPRATPRKLPKVKAAQAKAPAAMVRATEVETATAARRTESESDDDLWNSTEAPADARTASAKPRPSRHKHTQLKQQRLGDRVPPRRGIKPQLPKPPTGEPVDMLAGYLLREAGETVRSAMRDKVEELVRSVDEDKGVAKKRKRRKDVEDAVHDYVKEQRKSQDAAYEAMVQDRIRGNLRPLTDLCLQCIRNDPTLHAKFTSDPDGFAGSCLPEGMLERELAMTAKEAVKVPWPIAQYLWPYQREGVRWLFDVYSGAVSGEGWQARYGVDLPRGGILADEMGLGKTVQVIALIAALFGKTGTEHDLDRIFERRRDQAMADEVARRGPVLLVVPESVEDNWAEELARWGYFDVVHVGRLEPGGSKVTGREAVEEQLAQASRGLAEVVLFGYHRLARLVSDSVEFDRLRPCMTVFDEVHRVKNPNTRVSKAACAVKSAVKIGLTGTPMSNAVEELWGIMHVLSPHTFGPQQSFMEHFGLTIRAGRDQNATATALRKEREAKARLGASLKRIVKRRRKDVIKHQLRGKKDLMVLCPLTPKQEEVYLRVLRSPDYRKLLRSITVDNKQSSARMSDEDVLLGVPANDVDGPDMTECDPAVDSSLPLWRSMHRARHPDGKMCRHHVRVLKCEECEPRVTVYEDARHDSSEEESDEEPDEAGEVLRTFVSCGACNFCMGLAFLYYLGQVANHLELLRVDPLGRAATAKDKIRHRKRLRIAKLFLGKGSERPGDVAARERAFGGSPEEVWQAAQRPFTVSSRYEDLIDDTQCGKLQVLRKLLQRWQLENGVKVLIFSNSLVLLDILASYLSSLAIQFLRLDGNTPAAQRQGMCNKFNKDPAQFVFLMSTMAGGEGLNLTGASKVILFDPNWNPSKDLQAQDRSYRLGQDRFVEVYRFISQGTLEEAKFLRQVDKQQLSGTVLDMSNERRLFTGTEFKGHVELLRYSRSSYTQRINSRYSSERGKYMSKERREKLARSALRRRGEGFAVVPLDDPTAAEDDASAKPTATAEADPEDLQEERVVEDLLGGLEGNEAVTWDSMVGDAEEEREYGDDVISGVEGLGGTEAGAIGAGVPRTAARQRGCMRPPPRQPPPPTPRRL